MAKNVSKAWRSFENRVAKKLSKWLTRGVTDKALVRAPCSGGWPGKRAEGDIVANTDVSIPEDVRELAKHFKSKFVIECKRRKGSGDGWTLEQLLTAKKHPIIKWWEECTVLADRLARNRIMVIAKGQRGIPYVVLSAMDLAIIVDDLEVMSAYPWARFSLPWLDSALYVTPLKEFVTLPVPDGWIREI